MTQNPKTSLKKTGISWIGEIPEDWEVRYVKSIFRELSIKNHPNEKLLLASQSQWVIYKEEYWTRTTTALVNLESLKLVEIWNFVISLRSFQGGIEIAYRKGIISPAYTVFSEYTDIDRSYFKYLFKDCVFIQMLNTMNSGIRDGQSMSFEDFKYKLLPLPPLNTQTIIADFLDKKTEEITTLISNKKKLIELLREQKQSIIHRAVTKGIYPNEEMKDIWAPWIGEIPKSWGIKRLKYCIFGKLEYGANEPAESNNPDNPRYIRITDFWNDWFLRDDTFCSLAMEEAKNYLLEEWDILFARSGATVWKTFIFSNYDWKACFAWYLIRARVNREIINEKFLYLYTKSNAYEEWKSFIFNASTIQNIGADKYNNLLVPIPSLSHQKAIIEYIEQETSIINIAIEKIEKEITLIEEYQTSLIYQAVTGKISIS